MSAIFMRHRFSTINPDDIARVGSRSLSLNSVSFKPLSAQDEELEDEEEDEVVLSEDEEKAIGVSEDLIKHRRSSRARRVEPRLRKLKKRWSRLSQRYGFKHVVPIILLFLYSVIGALIFSAVELPNAQAKRVDALLALETNRRWAADSIIRALRLTNDSKSYDLMLGVLKMSDSNNSLPAHEDITWNIWGALFYVGTVFTTIGYGNIYPETTLGYTLTIVYAFFGVPLLLAILNDIGHLLAFYSSKWWRYLSSRIPDLRKKPKALAEEVVPESGVPVTLCLVLTFGWLLMCSGLFCLWEKNWSYFKAFYFFFISLSTIGLGDVVPEQPQLMIVNFWLVIIGLCLVSMTLGVVQERISLFLYRMMIELQKECEALLASGEDVDKKELLEKVWEQQPWYVRRLMPAFVNEVEQKRLEEFAGAAIADTAVSMGLIPPPPNYQPSTLQLTPSLVGQPSLLPLSATVATAPLAMIAEAKMKPTAASTTATPKVRQGQVSSRLKEPLAEISSQRQASAPLGTSAKSQEEILYPGGRAIVKRSHSCGLPPTRKVSITDPQERLQRALRTRIAATQTIEARIAKPLSSTSIQTEMTAADIMTKQETISNFSLGSWHEEDEALPFSLSQLQKLTAEDLKNLPGLVQLLKRKLCFLDKVFADAFAQTDNRVDSVSTSLSSNDEYVSAIETKPAPSAPSLPKLANFASKLVQTAPVETRWSSHPAASDIEVQTIAASRTNAEVQTSAIQREDAEVQCQAPGANDEEAQTPDGQPRHLQRPDLLPQNWSRDTSVDRSAQTVFVLDTAEKEVQTAPARTRNLEMQTDTLSFGSVETQTALDLRGPVSEGGTPLKVRIVSSSSIDGQDVDTEEYVTPPAAKISGGWSYSSWIANHDRLGSLNSVPEEEESNDEEQEEEEADLQEEDEYNDTEQQDLHGFTEEDDTATSDGVDLPPITASIRFDDEATADEASTMDEDIRGANRGSRRSRLISWKDIMAKEQVITASLATQTEELITRRQSFPKDAFTSKMRCPPVVYYVEEEAPKGKGHSHGLARWIKNRTRQSKRGSENAEPYRTRRVTATCQDVAVQTDSCTSEDVREIMIQTDDSYLMKARRFEFLRQNRTKSLAVAVAPHLKQHLAAAAARAKTAGPSEETKPKKTTPPRRR